MGIVKVDLLGLGMMAVLQDAIELVNTTASDSAGSPDARLRCRCQVRSRASAAGRSRRLRPAAEGRHDRRLPGRVARADGDAAAAEADVLLRPGRGGGDHPPRADRRRHGASLSESPRGPGAGRAAASVARAGARAHAGRAALPGAAAAHGDGGRRLHRRAGRGAAPRDGLQALGEADEADRGAAPRGDGDATASPARRRSGSSQSITSFALYGFPESHAASFALLAYASAYLKVHYPAAFYTALLNNQPMGFYHPATLVKDAQRRGVRFHPIDVQQSDWLCRVEDGRRDPPRLHVRERLAKGDGAGDGGIRQDEDAGPPLLCAKCGSDDESMIEMSRDAAIGTSR